MKDREALCNKCRLSTDHNSHADNKGTIITIEETRQRQVNYNFPQRKSEIADKKQSEQA